MLKSCRHLLKFRTIISRNISQSNLLNAKYNRDTFNRFSTSIHSRNKHDMNEEGFTTLTHSRNEHDMYEEECYEDANDNLLEMDKDYIPKYRFNLTAADRKKVARISEEKMKEKRTKFKNGVYYRVLNECLIMSGQHVQALDYLPFHRKSLKVSEVEALEPLFSLFAKESPEVFDALLGLIPLTREMAGLQISSALLEHYMRHMDFYTEKVVKTLAHNILDIWCIEWKPEDLFTKCYYFEEGQIEWVMKAFELVERPIPKLSPPSHIYPHPILKDFHKIQGEPAPLIPMDKEQILKKVNQQRQMEKKFLVDVKSVFHPPKALSTEEQNLNKRVVEWKSQMREEFLKEFIKYKKALKGDMKVFLDILPPEVFADIMMHEVDVISQLPPSIGTSYQNLTQTMGTKVMQAARIRALEKLGMSQKMQAVYNKYLEYSSKPSSDVNARQFWELEKLNNIYGPSLTYQFTMFPNNLLEAIGKILYTIINRVGWADPNICIEQPQVQKRKEKLFHLIYKNFKKCMRRREVVPSATLFKQWKASKSQYLQFPASELPMLCPPLPWLSIYSGGYLSGTSFLIRRKNTPKQEDRLKKTQIEHLAPVLDSINFLQECPWKLNTEILDLITDIFKKGGNNDLKIPQLPKEILKLDKGELDGRERWEYFRSQEDYANDYSLWCDFLYMISIADHFKNDIFWLPHNLDFRGRIYTTSSHFDHLKNDRCRALLLFANGKPLGPTGLKWLKLHLVNLTGMFKRYSIEDRLKEVEKLMPEIKDSAENPLEGRRWWATCSDPWQSLATCKEICRAIASGDPSSYICHMPIHQDGSCNGLQHYAALGRDVVGAQEVNLSPSIIPGDIYTTVAKQVEKIRQRDEADGNKYAKLLKGHISRKLVKQPVMTVVYGVTLYGATQQIERKLKDLPDIPKKELMPTSNYLAKITLNCLGGHFVSTKNIQHWLMECATGISQLALQPVSWITPLGFEVVQPYFMPTRTAKLDVTETSVTNPFTNPNARSQKNAFPANFIHSLDSSHLMATALHCQKSGLNFAAVHDCYWTHSKDVEIMNKICREQFLALHSLPLLENLSDSFLRNFSLTVKSKDTKKIIKFKKNLNSVFKDVPSKGSFDLKKVLESTFFFS